MSNDRSSRRMNYEGRETNIFSLATSTFHSKINNDIWQAQTKNTKMQKEKDYTMNQWTSQYKEQLDNITSQGKEHRAPRR